MTAHLRHARIPLDPHPGDYLVVGDDEVPPALAVVVSRESDGTLRLRILPGAPEGHAEFHTRSCRRSHDVLAISTANVPVSAAFGEGCAAVGDLASAPASALRHVLPLGRFERPSCVWSGRSRRVALYGPRFRHRPNVAGHVRTTPTSSHSASHEQSTGRRSATRTATAGSPATPNACRYLST